MKIKCTRFAVTTYRYGKRNKMGYGWDLNGRYAFFLFAFLNDIASKETFHILRVAGVDLGWLGFK